MSFYFKIIITGKKILDEFDLRISENRVYWENNFTESFIQQILNKMEQYLEGAKKRIANATQGEIKKKTK